MGKTVTRLYLVTIKVAPENCQQSLPVQSWENLTPWGVTYIAQ